jgi:hypothetical protein
MGTNIEKLAKETKKEALLWGFVLVWTRDVSDYDFKSEQSRYRWAKKEIELERKRKEKKTTSKIWD